MKALSSASQRLRGEKTDPEYQMQEHIGIVATVLLIIAIPIMCAWFGAKSFLRDVKRIICSALPCAPAPCPKEFHSHGCE